LTLIFGRRCKSLNHTADVNEIALPGQGYSLFWVDRPPAAAIPDLHFWCLQRRQEPID
jgi:hypothetical protein